MKKIWIQELRAGKLREARGNKPAAAVRRSTIHPARKHNKQKKENNKQKKEEYAHNKASQSENRSIQ